MYAIGSTFTAGKSGNGGGLGGSGGAGYDLFANGTVYPDAPWKAVIQNARGQVVRSWIGNGYSINLLWDGTNRSGKPVADGTYRFAATTEVLGETFSCPVIKKIVSR